jgi:hypothetical protein
MIHGLRNPEVADLLLSLWFLHARSLVTHITDMKVCAVGIAVVCITVVHITALVVGFTVLRTNSDDDETRSRRCTPQRLCVSHTLVFDAAATKLHRIYLSF